MIWQAIITLLCLIGGFKMLAAARNPKEISFNKASCCTQLGLLFTFILFALFYCTFAFEWFYAWKTPNENWYTQCIGHSILSLVALIYLSQKEVEA